MRKRHKARQALIVTLIGFVVIQLGLFAWLHLVPKLRDPQFGDKAQHLLQNIHTKEDPFVVVALGSSRTGMGFHARVVEEHLIQEWNRPVVAFNFGIPAVGPVTELIYFKRLLEEGIRPDLLLIEVHPALLANQGNESIEKRGIAVERLELDEIATLQTYGLANPGDEFQWWEASLFPSYGLRFPLVGRVLPQWLPSGLRFDWGRKTDAHGWNPCPWTNPSEKSRQDALKVAVDEYAKVLATLCLDTPSAKALNDLIALTQQEGIPTKLLLLPEGDTFRSLYPPEVENRLHHFLEDLCNKYQVECINARKWLPEEMFLDSHHLLQSGARQFSHRFAQTLVEQARRKEKGFDR